ncbi:MAG: signal peptidase I [Palaeococcus sp.]|uniref:signal peptidase I n=1 Tax=Palaeococcus sp. (in: euryarchaeotes) TaxID=2820298 RepID=UPI0025FEFF77|nr:signal peptidase I [Palaeococcus sp. (in: euryarchaeotes)]MCD6559294.1 signal peptidase I [Palaeococcus sp. (in: euryarchaeotes)]
MKRLLEYGIVFMVFTLVLGSVVGALLDRPVFMSYVYSDSMTPTINKGDLFFMNPFSRSADVGDIIVFNLRGTWTVHRVVAIVEGGYLTKGDNNVGIDQQGGRAPPVSRDKIAGKVITFGGTPLKIPRLGSYLQGRISSKDKMFLAGALIIFGALVFGTSEKKVKRKKRKKFFKLKFKTLYLLASALLLVMISTSMFVSWQVFSIEYAVTSAGGQREGWYLPDSTFEKELSIKNANFYPMIYFIAPDTPNIADISATEFDLSAGEEKPIEVTINAPEETSLYADKVRVNAYMPLLPRSLTRRLYMIHPILPVLVMLLETSFFLSLIYIISGIGEEDVLKIRTRRSSLWRQIKAEVFRI